MTDDELLSMVQEGCFRYYWEGAHPVAGLAPEILPGDPSLLAVGGNGFGVMALVVAAERQFVTREQAVARMLKIVRFLARPDRFHGAWPHFLNGDTGHVVPYFGKYDDGGDLVETAFMIQGLLAARQYFDRDTPEEREVRDTITRLWEAVEWDWYRKDRTVRCLYWHWSPDHGFYISHPLIGWNETMIVYLLAIASPTHPVPASSTTRVGPAPPASRALPPGLEPDNGRRPLRERRHLLSESSSTWARATARICSSPHFSFMGFDPRGRRDRFTNYFENNRAIALISHAYCMDNPASLCRLRRELLGPFRRDQRAAAAGRCPATTTARSASWHRSRRCPTRRRSPWRR